MKRNVLITGAVKGIGKAIAQRFVDDGYFVLLIDVEDGSVLEDELGTENAKYYSCDIRSEESVSQLFSEIEKTYTHLDVVVNNAGIIKDKVIWKMSLSEFEDVIDVNLKGTWLICRQAAIIMRNQKSGRIVNISSRAWLGNMGQSNYAASKGGVVSLTRVLALELGKHNVMVNAIAQV